MASKTDIANLALIKLGQQPTGNIDTDTAKAPTVLRTIWDVTLDSELQSSAWRFSRARIELAPSGIAPSWGWKYAYNKPTDFLNIVHIGNDVAWDNIDSFNVYGTYGISSYYNSPKNNYTVETNQILSNLEPPLYLIYTSNATPVNKYPALFIQAFVAMLAAQSCESILSNATKKQVYFSEYQLAIARAKSSDAIEVPISYEPPSDYILARL